MTAIQRRLAFWAVPAAVLAVLLVLLFRPQPVDVDLVPVTRGPITATVAEEGETRIRDVFVLSAPFQGRALRIETEEGDPVIANQTVVAEIKPIDPVFRDVRSQAEAGAAVETAKAALALARAELEQARAELAFATSEVARMRKLHKTDTVSERALDDAERTFRIKTAVIDTAEAVIGMRRSELAAAETRLLRPDQVDAGDCPCIPVRAPVSGKVLRVLHESEGVVAAGQPLVEIGDPEDLEIVVDYLSPDAVRMETGQRAIIEQWGGDEALNGRVSRIEPFGFTKVSALGIEEQRVNVVIDFTDPPERWARLAHGFQVDVRVVLRDNPAALKVPLTALYRDGDGWAVFHVVDGTAHRRPVELGLRSDLEAEIVAGLAEGAVIVRYPNDDVRDGVSVRRR